MSYGFLIVDYIVDRLKGSPPLRTPGPDLNPYDSRPDKAAVKSLISQHQHLWRDFAYNTPEERRALALRLTQAAFADHGIPEDCELAQHLSEVVYRLIYQEPAVLPPNVPGVDDLTPAQLSTIHDDLTHRVSVLHDETLLALIFEKVLQLLDELLSSLPPDISQALSSGLTPFCADIGSLIHKPHKFIDRILAHFIADQELNEHGLYRLLARQLYVNTLEASGIYIDPDRPLLEHDTHKPKLPSHCEKEPIGEVAERYLRGTPLVDLLSVSVPLHVPDELRYSHAHIIGGSGHGKTQTLQMLILHDLIRAAQSKASVIVIDSQGDLIRNIANLELFAPGGALADKLTLIEPKDIEYPICLNLFDVNMERLDTYAPLFKEQAINGVIELYDFVFGSLLGAEMTSKQMTLFRYITRLMISIPDANIQTLRQLMEDDGYERFKEHIQKLTGTARAFFETEFQSREFEQTKKQVLRRLWAILENQTFERMFSHPRNKLDIFKEMNEGRVILISTSKDLLKQNGTQIFGRFFIAMIAQAAFERAPLPEQERTPTFLYIDECQDYVDENIALILEQARKYKLSINLSHQYLGQLDPKSQQAFAANTSMKMAGGVSSRDARALAADMRTTPQFIEAMHKGEFALHVRGLTSAAVKTTTTFGLMEQLPRMSAEQFTAIRDRMREKYAVHYSEVQQIISDQLPGHAPEHSEADIASSDEPEEITPATYTAPKAGPADPRSKTS